MINEFAKMVGLQNQKLDNNYMPNTLGSLIRLQRQKVNLSTRNVEAAIGISSAYLSQLENDKIKKPSPFFLKKLAKLYDSSFEELMMAAQYIDSAVISIRCPVCGHYVNLK